MKTFGKATIGIHGGELPKFADSPDTKKYWQFISNSYNKKPNNNIRKSGIGKRRTKSVLGDFDSDNAFSKIYIPIHKKDEIITKVNNEDYSVLQKSGLKNDQIKGRKGWMAVMEKLLNRVNKDKEEVNKISSVREIGRASCRERVSSPV